MGLIMGCFVLISQRYLSADLVHNLLTFNPADFFTCGPCFVTFAHSSLNRAFAALTVSS